MDAIETKEFIDRYKDKDEVTLFILSLKLKKIVSQGEVLQYLKNKIFISSLFIHFILEKELKENIYTVCHSRLLKHLIIPEKSR